MALRSRLHVSKDEVVADNGIVAANHPLSSEAGLEMLKQGGNAVDAAVATGFVGCVVEPMMTCIAGCGFMLIHLAREGRSVAIEFSPRAPKAATPDMYQVEESAIEDIGIQSVRFSENIYGYKAISVPGTVAGFCLAHDRYGALPMEQVMEPAIHLAEEGFEVDWYTAVTIATEMDLMVRFPAGWTTRNTHQAVGAISPKRARSRLSMSRVKTGSILTPPRHTTKRDGGSWRRSAKQARTALSPSG